MSSLKLLHVFVWVDRRTKRTFSLSFKKYCRKKEHTMTPLFLTEKNKAWIFLLWFKKGKLFLHLHIASTVRASFVSLIELKYYVYRASFLTRCFQITFDYNWNIILFCARFSSLFPLKFFRLCFFFCYFRIWLLSLSISDRMSLSFTTYTQHLFVSIISL